MNLAAAVPSFLASLVEFVEALTIVLAVGATRGWSASLRGAAAAIALLAATVAVFGPLLERIPLRWLQLAIGVLLLVLGTRWLRKAVLRYAGRIPFHDERAIFAKRAAALAAAGDGASDWAAMSTSFNAVMLEGYEVVAIVLGLGSTPGTLVPAICGAVFAAVCVVVAGIALRSPLERVPENTLKFAVALALCAIGTFWTLEALGLAWPGGDAAPVWVAALYLALSAAAIGLLRAKRPAA